MGTVTCVAPLKVKPDDCSEEFQWDEVRLPLAQACRQRCRYADKCYRKNPDHKKDFCHPGEPDWEQAAHEEVAVPERRKSAQKARGASFRRDRAGTTDSRATDADASAAQVPDELEGYMR